jgi:2'-5' RNA ligase
MCRAQAEVHDLLRRQFGLRAAGNFMPHATIKGTFKSLVSEAEIIDALNGVVEGRSQFPVYSEGLIEINRRGIMLSIQHLPDGRQNEPLQHLHDAAMDALLPLAAPDCEFTTPNERIRDRFHAHLTLAMADVPPFAFDEIYDFIRDLGPIGPQLFTTEYLHLYAFESDAWGGKWWETLRWTLLRSWKLPPSATLSSSSTDYKTAKD